MEKNTDRFTNKEISHLLRSMAAAYLIKGENRFKIIAYDNAADTVEHLTRELKDYWQEGQIYKIHGIGPSIASHLDEYFKNGRSKHFDSVLREIPETVFELIKVRSIGPKKGYKLIKALKLKNVKTIFKDIIKACSKGKIAKIAGFGEKSQKNILNEIKIYLKNQKRPFRMPFPYGLSYAQEIYDYLKKNKEVKEINILGSLRRKTATIGDIDLAVAVSGKEASSVIDYFVKYPKKIAVDNAGKKKASIIISPNIRVDLRVEEIDGYGSMLQYLTGSKAHNIKLREYSLKKGYSISEYGIKDINNNKRLKFRNEKDFYNFLNLQYIPPELREGTNEIELAKKNKLPILVRKEDLKGDFHIHSSYDLEPTLDLGKDSYQSILEKGDDLKYQYVGFSDHNPSLNKNNKNKVITIMKRRKEYIDQLFLNKKVYQSKYFIGLEVDILSNGEIALPKEAIQYVDYLIVSIHSSFNMSIKDMTDRVLKGLSFPKVKILGHPTGRILGKRDGFKLDWKKIFSYCDHKKIALEINSWPDRLDLPDTLVHKAINNRVKLVINTDAHSVNQMDNIKYGVYTAQRGWARKNDIINTLPYNKVREWIKISNFRLT